MHNILFKSALCSALHHQKLSGFKPLSLNSCIPNFSFVLCYRWICVICCFILWRHARGGSLMEYTKRRHYNNRRDDRRKGQKDTVGFTIRVINAVGWVIVLAAVLLVEQARPRGADFFTRYFNANLVGGYWNKTLIYIALASLVAVFLASIVGFILNTRRHKRETDRYSISTLVLGVLSLFGMALLVWRFGSML